MSPSVSPTAKVSSLVPDDNPASDKHESPRASPQPPSPKHRDPTPAPEPAKEPPADDQDSVPNAISISELLDLYHSRGIIDMETFNQVLELDEEGSHEFSIETIRAYFEQATDTFKEMDTAYAAKDLPGLSSLGHFLKGSSAALGLTKVQISCERIQHYGECRDEETKVDLSESEALEKINTTLKCAKTEYGEAEKGLQAYCDYYGGNAT